MVFRYVVSINYPNGGGPGVNVWHFRGPSVGNDSQLAVDAIRSFYEPIIAAYQPTTLVTGPDEVTSDIETQAPAFQPVVGWSLATPAGGQSLPPSNQIVCGWRTANATRSGRGRTFVGPLNAGSIDPNGTPLGATLDAVRAGAQAIVDFNGQIDDGAIGVWSPTDGVIRDITSFTVRDTFAVLRSRRD